jgi:hypothetical protein
LASPTNRDQSTAEHEMRNNKAKSVPLVPLQFQSGSAIRQQYQRCATCAALCRFWDQLRGKANPSGRTPPTLSLLLFYTFKEEQRGTGKKCLRRSGFLCSTSRNRADQSGTWPPSPAPRRGALDACAEQAGDRQRLASTLNPAPTHDATEHEGPHAWAALRDHTTTTMELRERTP